MEKRPPPRFLLGPPDYQELGILKTPSPFNWDAQFIRQVGVWSKRHGELRFRVRRTQSQPQCTLLRGVI